MGLTDPFTRVANRGIESACSRYLDRRFVVPFFDKQALAAEHWQHALSDAGVELKQVIRARSDTRGVLLVSHPEKGLCVLKTLFATRHPARALANLAGAHLAEDADVSIFPRVFDATASYSLEEYIDGRPFRAWLADAFDEARMSAFFQGLKNWSEAPRPLSSGATLRPYQIREICRTYVTKCLRHSRFSNSARRLRTVARFSRAGDELAARIEWLWSAAERIALPRGLMCGDMGNVNILVQRETSRLYNVDYETMGPGHHGFDCGYFISSLVKMDDDPSKVAAIRRLVLNDEYFGSSGAGEFFTVYTDVLADIGRVIYAGRPDA